MTNNYEQYKDIMIKIDPIYSLTQ